MFTFRNEPSFSNQPAFDDLVWRYMDMPRFLSILEYRALHFVRADQMVDKWEGAFGAVNIQQRMDRYGEQYPYFGPLHKAIDQQRRQSFHMNCWHLSPIESAAMWDLYQRDGQGVAIRSTWGALTSSIRSGPELQVCGAAINYIDYAKESIPEDLFSSFLHKRKSYEHEKEVRLLAMTNYPAQLSAVSGDEGNASPAPTAVSIPVDVQKLIKQVFVAPLAPEWIYELTKAVVRRYGYKFDVNQSDLAADPIF